jgi:hypothetical protein
MRWARNVAWMGEKMNVYMLLVGKPEGMRLLGRPRRRWTHNIKMDLVEIDEVVWTGLVWFRIRTSWELLWMQQWTFEFHRMLGNYRVATRLVDLKWCTAPYG